MDWHEVIFAAVGMVGISGAIVQMGMLRNQILINTKRLDKLEDIIVKVREHISDTNAHWPNIEQRLDRLEKKVLNGFDH